MLGVMLMIILLQGGKCRHEESLLVEAENRHKNVTNPSSPIPAILSENGITEGCNNTTTLTPQLQTTHIYLVFMLLVFLIFCCIMLAK